MRSDESFQMFWKSIRQKASDLKINEPVFPRSRKRPSRYEYGSCDSEIPDDIEDNYRHILL